MLLLTSCGSLWCRSVQCSGTLQVVLVSSVGDTTVLTPVKSQRSIFAPHVRYASFCFQLTAMRIKEFKRGTQSASVGGERFCQTNRSGIRGFVSCVTKSRFVNPTTLFCFKEMKSKKSQLVEAVSYEHGGLFWEEYACNKGQPVSVLVSELPVLYSKKNVIIYRHDIQYNPPGFRFWRVLEHEWHLVSTPPPPLSFLSSLLLSKSF